MVGKMDGGLYSWLEIKLIFQTLNINNNTLPQKKHNFNPPIFPDALGFLTLIRCHVEMTLSPRVT